MMKKMGRKMQKNIKKEEINNFTMKKIGKN